MKRLHTLTSCLLNSYLSLDVTDYVNEQLKKDKDPEGTNYLSPTYLNKVAERFAKAAKLKLADTAQIVVLDIDGQQVPYQVTYDEKVVFPVTYR